MSNCLNYVINYFWNDIRVINWWEIENYNNNIHSGRGRRLKWKVNPPCECSIFHLRRYSTRRELSFISIKLPCVSTSLHHSTHKGINLIQIRVRWIEMDRDQQSGKMKKYGRMKGWKWRQHKKERASTTDSWQQENLLAGRFLWFWW